jgi:hypothetical protein
MGSPKDLEAPVFRMLVDPVRSQAGGYDGQRSLKKA